MWTNNLKIARRKLLKNKASTFTKLFSLSIGLISLFYISLYLDREMHFDDFHRHPERIVKVNTDIRSPTGDLSLGLSAVPLGPVMKASAPEIEAYVRINKEYGSHSIRQGNALFSESENIYYADPAFFELFTFPMKSGNPQTALLGPDKVVITTDMALKYFGREDVVGKSIRYDGNPLTVSGVLEELPPNTHLKFDFLISMPTFMRGRPEDVNDNWTWFPMNTYFLLQRASDRASLETKLKALPQYLPENSANDEYVLSLEPLEGLHFSSPKLGELGPKGSLPRLYLLFAIALLILLLAVFNFINLTTAGLSMESKNVSMKRTLGASRNDIFRQFMTESLLVSCLALFLSAAGIILTYSSFRAFLGGALDLSALSHPLSWAVIAFFPLVLTLLGGVYPSLKFARIPSLPKAERTGRQQKLLSARTGLLVFQFAITAGLVVGSLIIMRQLDFLQDQELGIDLQQKLVIDYGPNSAIGESFASLKEQFLEIPGVESATFSSHVPGQIPNGVSTLIQGVDGRERNGEIGLNLVDPDFLRNYGLELIAGRDFRPGVADTTAALILNEAAVKAFGYTRPEDIIGASYEQWGGNGQVVGVVRDFNYLSLHDDIGLLSLKIWPRQFEKITLGVSTGHLDKTLADLQHKWETLYPEIPFKYYFADDQFRLQYASDRQFATIMNLFTLISICIGILGLVAYATFWCNRRKKEISIKKVLGARVPVLLWNVYRGFSLPVLTGFLIAAPVSSYFGKQWLEQFAYHFEVRWYFFVTPLLILLCLVALAAGAQTLQLVRANPAEQLKAE